MVKVSDELCMVDLKNIVDMCIYMAIDNIIVICEEPNHHEKNL